MKKLLKFVFPVIRVILVLLPGTISYFWLFRVYPVTVNLMASIGVEALFLIVLGFAIGITAALKSHKSTDKGD